MYASDWPRHRSPVRLAGPLAIAATTSAVSLLQQHDVRVALSRSLATRFDRHAASPDIDSEQRGHAKGFVRADGESGLFKERQVGLTEHIAANLVTMLRDA